jgi:hypothetical protein
MHMNHASHALLNIQYVHASNLGIYIRCFKTFIHSQYAWYEGEYQKHKDDK